MIQIVKHLDSTRHKKYNLKENVPIVINFCGKTDNWPLKSYHIHSFSNPLSSGWDRGATTLGGLEIPHGQQQSMIFLLLHSTTGPSKVGDTVMPCGLWSTCVSLCRVCAQKSHRQTFLEHLVTGRTM